MQQQFDRKNRAVQDFVMDLKDGRRAEKALAMWIDSTKYFDSVRVVNEPGHDIECLKGADTYFLEVKRDSYTDDNDKGGKGTNNICIELWSNFEAGNIGWIQYSDADLLYYVSNRYIYKIHMKRLRRFVNKIVSFGQAPDLGPSFKVDVKGKKVSMMAAPNNGNHKVRNLIIDKQYLIDSGCILKVIDRKASGFDESAKFYSI